LQQVAKFYFLFPPLKAGKRNGKSLRLFLFFITTQVNNHPKNTEKDKGIRSPEEPAEISYTHKFADKITNDTADNKKGTNPTGNQPYVLANLTKFHKQYDLIEHPKV
jgi:hypothetical protein